MAQNPVLNPLRLGTRGSKLALVQANMVAALLKASVGVACEIVVLKTSGDRVQDRPLADIGGKGLFTKELEEALHQGTIDLAVHSMKDVPATIPEGLLISAILPREDARDAFVSSVAPTFEELPKGARIGTSSVRRAAQVRRARPDLELLPLRGNVDTRLSKLDAGAFDAILLAHAGLRRLGLQQRIASLMPTAKWLPALAQGAIGIEVRRNDHRAAATTAGLNDKTAEIALACERSFQAALDGSCRTPIAGHAQFSNGALSFSGEVIAPDGSGDAKTAFDRMLGSDPVRESADAGFAAGMDLKPRAARWLVL